MAKENAFGITPALLNDIRSVFKKYPKVHSAILYGSRAMGNFRRGSDIDITIEGDEIDLHQLYKISYDLYNLSTPYQFDLSIFQHIENQDLLNHIMIFGVTIYNKTDHPHKQDLEASGLSQS